MQQPILIDIKLQTIPVIRVITESIIQVKQQNIIQDIKQQIIMHVKIIQHTIIHNTRGSA